MNDSSTFLGNAPPSFVSDTPEEKAIELQQTMICLIWSRCMGLNNAKETSKAWLTWRQKLKSLSKQI